MRILAAAASAFACVFNDFASIFRGLTYYSAGAVSAVADGPREVSKIITPANVIGGRITYSEAAEDARHSVIAAQWKDPSQDHKLVSETVEDGEMLRRYGYRRKVITAFAAKTRGQARRAALWCLATEKWESGVAKFSAGIELAWLRPGDVIAIADPLIAGDRMGGRCRAITLSQLALDAQVLFTPGESYSIMVVMPDGSVATRGLVTPDQHDDLVELNAPLEQLPVDGAMFVVTGTDVAPVQYRVLNITEDEPHIFSFDVMRYERHKFAWIENGVKFDPDPISRWVGELGAPTGLLATSVLYLAKDGVAARLELSWTPQDDPRIRAYEVEVQDPGASAWRRDAITAQVSVVLTSTAMCPWVKAAITAFFSSGGMRECSRPTITPGRASLKSACVAVALERSSASLSSISGHTQYTCRPCATWSAMRAMTSSRRLSDTSLVTMGVRPGGSSSMVETSRSA